METIRRIEEDDFKAVSALYNGRKSIEELKWLFTNPYNSTIYNAFVAEKDKKIVGICGYVLSEYTKEEKTIYGVIPMSWKVSSDYKGMAGILLLRKVLNLGDFSFTISGTHKAEKLYPLFNLNYHSEIHTHYKILRPIKYYNFLKRTTLLKKVGMFFSLLPSFLKSNNSKKNNQITLIPYQEKYFSLENDSHEFLKKKLSKKYLHWLLHCPLIYNSYAFHINYNTDILGICVLYINKVGNIKNGRIVYLPEIGNNKISSIIIDKCTLFLKERGCISVTGRSHTKSIESAFLKSGFVKLNRHSLPLYVKDDKNIFNSLNITQWHIQYSEGDKAYRLF